MELPPEAGRARDVAARIGVSEAELVWAKGAGGQGGVRVVRIGPDWPAVLQALPRLGTVMALTRNEAAVHEKKGPYRDVKLFAPMAGVFERDIDLRLDLRHWATGFAVEERGGDGAARRSLQFFGPDGDAVHKVHLLEHSDHAAFAEIATELALGEDPAGTLLEPAPASPARPDAEVDVPAFHAAWDGMKDVHEFRPLLERLGLDRRQAFRLAGPDRAVRLDAQAFSKAAGLAAERGVSIMIFVANPGCTQIHTGPIARLERRGPWWNVLDPDFNLHLREDLLAEAWVVRKPTRFGTITSIELFDRAGGLVLMLFGERARRAEETRGWRRIVAEVEAGAPS